MPPVSGGTDDLTLAAPLLADLFCLTARDFRGSEALLAEDLAVLETAGLPGMAEYLAAYRDRGCPAVHHSARYREAYAPHYRVLSAACGGYFPALLRIARLAARGVPAVVAVDGRCGSGKSGLGSLIGALFPCNVVHMDDYYLPPDQRDRDWESIPGGNMDLARFLREVLVPAGTGEPVRCRAYDCQNGRMGREMVLPARPLTVVEGSYSQHPLLAARYDLRIFLTCDPEEQRRRLERREGRALPRLPEPLDPHGGAVLPPVRHGAGGGAGDRHHRLFLTAERTAGPPAEGRHRRPIPEKTPNEKPEGWCGARRRGEETF